MNGISLSMSVTIGDDKMISFALAQRLTLENIAPLPSEMVALSEALGRLTAEAIYSQVDSPSAHVSSKDGYAVQSSDVAQASTAQPAKLHLEGFSAAGANQWLTLEAGSAIRIMSGAALPAGADAVVAEEFASMEGEAVFLTRDAHPGRNVIAKGSDVARGQFLLAQHTALQPAQLGLIASAGVAAVKVYQRPRVAIIATGDEVIAPGTPLQDGKLFASNLVTLAAWCAHFGMPVSSRILPDLPAQIEAGLEQAISTHDAVLTSGGAWNSERDLVIHILEKLGWREIYHRVKIGPGKAIGFGLLHGKPVFCLPGGPPSNYMAFINLALPGLMQLGGFQQPGLPEITARLDEQVAGQIDWTQFIQGRLEPADDLPVFHPLPGGNRLHMMADAQGLLTIPEGVEQIPAGSAVRIRVMTTQ